MKKIVAFVACLILIAGLAPEVMGADYKTRILNYDIELVQKDGKTWDGPCGAFALAYCMTIFDGKTHSYSDYWKNENAQWGNGKYTAGYYENWPNSKANGYIRLYNEINKGKPVIARVNGKPNFHYVVVVGYEGVLSEDALDSANFIIIDPNDPTTTKNMKTAGYDLKADGNGKYQIVYDNNNRGSVGFQKEELRCDHSTGYKTVKKPDGMYVAVCKNCDSEFKLPELNSAVAGIYKTNTKVYLCSAPYQDSRYEQKTPKGSSLTIIGSVENAYGNTWYKTEDGKWVYKSYVKKVKDLPASIDKLTLADAVYPSSLEVGAFFSVYGKITSSVSEISEVTVGVYDAAGKLCTGKTVSVNAKTFEVFSVDRDVYFNKLTAGIYYYRIIAKNSAGTTMLLDASFTVGASVSKEYYFDLNGFLDGRKATSISGYGTADIYINSILVADDVSDYYKKWPTGTVFEVKDIRTANGCSYGGAYNSLISGKIDGDSEAILIFDTSTEIRDGYYRLSPQCAPGSCLDSESGTTDEGSNVVINTKSDLRISQCFYISSTGDGYYTLDSGGSGMMLDVYYARTEAGTNTQLWEDNGTDAQLWQIIDQGNGYYTLVPKVNPELALDVDYAMSSDGTNVKLWYSNGTNAQAWMLEPAA